MEGLSVVRSEAELEERTSHLVAQFLVCLEFSGRTKFPFAMLEEARDFIVDYAQKYGVPPDQTTDYPRSHGEYKRLLSERLTYILAHIREYNPSQFEAALDELENWLTEDRLQNTPTEKTSEQQTATRRRMRLAAAAILGIGIFLGGTGLCAPEDPTQAQRDQQISPQAPR